MAVDPSHAGTGAGSALLAFAEIAAQQRHACSMQLELLAPRPALPHFERLAGWYGRLGYCTVERLPLERFDAASAAELTRTCDVILMRKPLA